MAFLLHQNAALRARQQAHRQVVRQGSGGKEDRFLFAENTRQALFDILDDSAKGIAIRLNVLFFHQARQKTRVFGRVQTEAIGDERYPILPLRNGGCRRPRQRGAGCQKCSALHPKILLPKWQSGQPTIELRMPISQARSRR